MIQGLAHVCIGTPNLEASEAFYCQTLGLEKRFTYHRGGRPYGFYLALPGGSFIEIFKQEDADPNMTAPLRHFCLQVDDIDAFITAMRGKNVEVSAKQRGKDKTWQVWLTDPTGIAVEVQQYTDESRQQTGEDYHQDAD